MGQHQGETGAWKQTENQAITSFYWLKPAKHEAKCNAASIIGCTGLAAARREEIMAGDSPVEVGKVVITDAGRSAIEE